MSINFYARQKHCIYFKDELFNICIHAYRKYDINKTSCFSENIKILLVIKFADMKNSESRSVKKEYNCIFTRRNQIRFDKLNLAHLILFFMFG